MAGYSLCPLFDTKSSFSSLVVGWCSGNVEKDNLSWGPEDSHAHSAIILNAVPAITNLFRYASHNELLKLIGVYMIRFHSFLNNLWL